MTGTDATAPRGYAALLERSGVGPAPAADFLDLAGPDAPRFANGYLTCDTRALAEGRHTRGFLTGRDGKVLAEADVVALAGRLRLRLPSGSREGVAAHLGRYLLADRVELEPRSDLSRLRLEGPAVPELLAALGAAAPAPGEVGIAELAGAALHLLGVARGSRPRWEIWGEVAALPAVEAALLDAGAERASAAAFETLRVEAGELAFGVDFGSESFPQESGDEGAVSYTKGCYLGQEVVARLRWRGQAQRVAWGLRFPDALPAPGAVVLHDGRPAGRATSVARSPRCGAIGLALLHRRVGEPPARLELEGGLPAELAPLPFL